MTSPLFTPFTLPNNSTLKNRIVKAAMEEKLADVPNGNQPSQNLIQLYKTWAQGGSALVLSGHIMIDPLAMASPGDVLLSRDVEHLQSEARWKEWVAAAKTNSTQFWLQINHPGRQIGKGSGLPTYGPSAIALDMGVLSSMFDQPREMSEAKIQDVIQRFRWTAKRAEELGVDGVEIHAAHGYLLSAFLSPKSNQRSDRWGGSRENRARLLFEVVRVIRGAVSPGFGVGVKINTADFQRGGFDEEDLKWTVLQLNGMGLDFIELSGGNYELPAMGGASAKGEKKSKRTIEREAYFIEAAEALQKVATVPLVVTGGITKKETAEAVVSLSGNVLAGMGTALGFIPNLPNRWLAGEAPGFERSNSWVLPGMLKFLGGLAGVQWNLHNFGKGKEAWTGVWPALAVVWSVVSEKGQMGGYKKWVGGLQQKQASEEKRS